MSWTFSLRPDEPVLLRWHRLFDELLANGPISLATPGGILADFLDVVGKAGDPVALIAGKPTSHIEQWRTNCAMTQHAAMVWCGREMKPDVNGESIYQYVELACGDARWIDNDGTNRPVGPAIFYVSPSARLPFDHVGAFMTPIDADAGHWNTAEGGGGDGTKIGRNDRVLTSPDSYGRHIAGWWEILDLLPPSADSAPENVTDNAGPDTVPAAAPGTGDE